MSSLTLWTDRRTHPQVDPPHLSVVPRRETSTLAEEPVAAGELTKRDGDGPRKLCPSPWCSGALLWNRAMPAGRKGRSKAGTLGTSTFISHGIKNSTQDTKGKYYTLKRCKCYLRIHLQVTSALMEESGISSGVFFWLSKVKFKARSFLRIQSSNIYKETYRLHSLRNFLKGRRSIWNAKKKFNFLESK